MGEQDPTEEGPLPSPPPRPRFRHSVPFQAAAFARDRATLVGLDADGMLVGWDARSGRLLYRTRTLRGGEGPHRLTCSPDGRFVAISHRDPVPSLVRVLELGTGKERRRFDRCLGPCFSPDGEILAGTDGPRLRRWSLKSGAELPALEEDGAELKWAAYSPTGKRLAASYGASASISIWNLETRRRTFHGGGSEEVTRATSLAFSPDEKTLAVGSLWGVHALSVTGEAPPTFVGHEEYSNGPLKYSSDGRWMVALCQRRRLLVWEAATGWVRMNGGVSGIPEGFLELSEGADAIVWIDPDGLRVERIPEPLGGAGERSSFVAGGFTSDGRAITGDLHGEFRVWDPSSQRELRRSQGPKAPVRLFAEAGRWAVLGGETDPIRIWDVQAERELLRVPAFPGCRAMAVSPHGGRLALGYLDGTLALWDVAANRELSRVKLDPAGVTAIGWSGDGASIAWGNERGAVVIGDGRTAGDRTEYEPRGSKGISLLQFSPSGKLLLAMDRKGNCFTYDGAVGREPVPANRESIERFRCAPPDRRWAASGLLQFRRGPAVFSADGSYALTIDGGVAQIWEAPGGR